MQFTPVLALYDPFGVDVPLNLDITHSLTHSGMANTEDILQTDASMLVRMCKGNLIHATVR